VEGDAVARRLASAARSPLQRGRMIPIRGINDLSLLIPGPLASADQSSVSLVSCDVPIGLCIS
jgi:hypothetical protein